MVYIACASFKETTQSSTSSWKKGIPLVVLFLKNQNQFEVVTIAHTGCV